jgi:hypothetical protein
MHRSSRWRRRRPSDSTSSAHGSGPTPPTPQSTLTGVPDGTRRLADGLVIDATIIARVLGIRLLRIHAGVTVAPARILARASAPRAGVAPRVPERALVRSRPIGADLATAQRCIDAGRASLAAALPMRDGRG